MRCLGGKGTCDCSVHSAAAQVQSPVAVGTNHQTACKGVLDCSDNRAPTGLQPLSHTSASSPWHGGEQLPHVLRLRFRLLSECV